MQSTIEVIYSVRSYICFYKYFEKHEKNIYLEIHKKFLTYFQHVNNGRERNTVLNFKFIDFSFRENLPIFWDKMLSFKEKTLDFLISDF